MKAALPRDSRMPAALPSVQRSHAKPIEMSSAKTWARKAAAWVLVHTDTGRPGPDRSACVRVYDTGDLDWTWGEAEAEAEGQR